MTTPDSVDSDSFSFESSQHSSNTAEELAEAKSNTSELSPDVETVYQKAVQFIKLTNELKSAPEALTTKCEYLETLKEQLSTSIDELKRQSDTVLSKK